MNPKGASCLFLSFKILRAKLAVRHRHRQIRSRGVKIFQIGGSKDRYYSARPHSIFSVEKRVVY